MCVLQSVFCLIPVQLALYPILFAVYFILKVIIVSISAFYCLHSCIFYCLNICPFHLVRCPAIVVLWECLQILLFYSNPLRYPLISLPFRVQNLKSKSRILRQTIHFLLLRLSRFFRNSTRILASSMFILSILIMFLVLIFVFFIPFSVLQIYKTSRNYTTFFSEKCIIYHMF